MTERPAIHNFGSTLDRVNNNIVDNAPRVLRATGLGFGLGAATLDQNWVVAGLSLVVSAGAAGFMHLRSREDRKRNNSR